jgi:two-component system nitrogen regulation sensor histidine kinase NtrY
MGQLNVFMRSFADVVRLPPPVRQPVDLVELLRRIDGLVRADREARRISWHWAIDEDPAVVPMDPVQVEQALLNIVKNAIEAIDDAAPRGAAGAGAGTELRGTVTVRLKRIGTRLRLEVEDTGPGIPPDVREGLFTPFFTTKPGGQGIGLTVVQEILSNHGFAFSLESASGRPTTFTIDF